MLNVITACFIILQSSQQSAVLALFFRKWPEKCDLWHRSITNSDSDRCATMKQTTVWRKGQICSACAHVCDSLSHSSVCVAQVLILTASRSLYYTHTQEQNKSHTLHIRMEGKKAFMWSLWFWFSVIPSSVRLGEREVVLVAVQSGSCGQINKVCKLRSRSESCSLTVLGSCWLFVWYICPGFALQNRETVTKQTFSAEIYLDVDCDSQLAYPT